MLVGEREKAILSSPSRISDSTDILRAATIKSPGIQVWSCHPFPVVKNGLRTAILVCAEPCYKTLGKEISRERCESRKIEAFRTRFFRVTWNWATYWWAEITIRFTASITMAIWFWRATVQLIKVDWGALRPIGLSMIETTCPGPLVAWTGTSPASPSRCLKSWWALTLYVPEAEKPYRPDTVISNSDVKDRSRLYKRTYDHGKLRWIHQELLRWFPGPQSRENG